ncbi:hypothetical protein JHK85_025805 [Glycine max]|nr:hypothetical protein JHK85_025805 [Glycine max]KAG5013043.1 hypothetical protein JHK86_025304 [Glycine max]
MLWDEAHCALVLTPHAYYTLTDDSNMDTRPNTNTNALTWSIDEQVYIKADDGDVKPELPEEDDKSELPEEDDKSELPNEIGQKKIRATGSQMTSTNDSADAHLLENAQKCTREN